MTEGAERSAGGGRRDHEAAPAPAAEAEPPVDLGALGRLPEEWASALSAAGEPSYRGRQIFRWIQQRGVFDAANMSDLPAALRERLRAGGIATPARVVSVRRSADGTRKLLLELSLGARIECVLIPMTREGEGDDADAAAADDTDDPEIERAPEATPVTLCVSTQFGCAMGCTFCASGQAGLLRGLKAAEIVAQVLLARRYVEPGETLKNLVFMGMGEPLHHYDETARALRLLMHEQGQNLSPRRITVSTVGLVPGIRRLGEDFQGKVGLAISLHAPNDAVRDRLLPINQRYPIRELLSALRAYPLPRRRRITIEYTLVAGVNDRPEHARELARLLARIPVKINLIPMNPIAASPLRAPEADRVREFQRILQDAGHGCYVRTRRGDEVDAACGQLALLGARRDERAEHVP